MVARLGVQITLSDWRKFNTPGIFASVLHYWVSGNFNFELGTT
jgi:hypothetical protein